MRYINFNAFDAPIIFSINVHCTLQDALFICYKQSPHNASSIAFSQRASSRRMNEDETVNDSDIINNLINYEDRSGELPGFFVSG
ncbi:hypothetical protein TNCV_132261 [Trichonephila clavipes]|nr:hypothetical protein TNCV_132261 [Trichonephila clavipes]